MGITINRTPKCHCELAGEGIEYAWGCAKNYYQHQILLDRKRGKDNFIASIRKRISRDVLMRDKMQKFRR